MSTDQRSTASYRLSLTVLAACNFAVGMGAFMVVGLLSPVARFFDIDAATAGWLMSAYAMTYAVASPILISVLGNQDRKWVLAAGLGVFAVGALAAAMAPGYAWLLVARAVMAVGGGLVTPVAASIAVMLAPSEMRGRALATVFGGLTIAQVLGVPAGAWIAYAVGWQAAFLVVVGLAGLAALILFVILPRGLQTAANDLGTLARVIADPKLLLAIGVTTILTTNFNLVVTYLAVLYEGRYGLSRDGVTGMLLVLGAGAVIGNALGGRLTDRIGPVAMLVMICVCQTILTSFLTLFALPISAAIILLFFWSVSGWAFMAPQQARLVGLVPSRMPVMLALNASAIYVGASIGPIIGGYVLRYAAIEWTGPAAALVAAVGLVAVWVSSRQTARG